MNILTNIFAFAVALSVIIFVHEMGHLLVAKAFRMKVPVFSIGFGRALWKFQRGGTEYRVAWLPLGGYVRLGGDDPEELSDDPRDFLNRPRWQRILVYLAGPTANGVLAIVLMTGVLMVGITSPILPNLPPVVGDVIEDGAGAAAGIEPGDRVLEVDGKPVTRWDQVQFVMATSANRELLVTVERDGERIQSRVKPRPIPGYEIGDAGLFPQLQPQIARVLPGGSAEQAGLRAGDTLRAIDGRPVVDRELFVRYIEGHVDEAVTVEIVRGGRQQSITVVPADQDGVGRIGIELGYFQRYGPVRAVVESTRYTSQIASQTLAAVGRIVTGRLKARSALSGPIQIAAWSGEAARSGPSSLIQLTALISISIGLLNLFPIPILDGGQIVLLLLESAIRRDLPLKLKERIQQLGFVLIVALMVMVLYFDLARNLSGILPGS